jgi:UTP:GlnB (protein PII) uridylyltransferase
MSLSSDIFQNLVTAKTSPPVGEFSKPWVEQSLTEQPHTCRLAPQWKQIIDQEARSKFLDGVSSTALSRKLSDQYQSLLAGVFIDSGLYDHLRNLGVTPLAVGGLARGNSSVRSDFDLVLWGEDRHLTALEDTFKRGQPHQGFALLSELNLHGVSVSRPLRSVSDLAGHLRNAHIDTITALLNPKPLVAGDSNFPAIEHQIHQFVQENHREILLQIGQSVREREHIYGAIFTLAQFNLKESRGGLRDCDTADWVRAVQRICGYQDDLVTPENAPMLTGIAEVLNKAKHAWHLSQDTAPSSFMYNDLQAVNVSQRRPADKVNYVGYGGRREEFCQLLSDSLGGLLHERDVDEMIYRAAILNARFIDEQVLALCRSLQSNQKYSAHPTQVASAQPLISKRSFADHLYDSEAISPYVRQLFQSGDLARLWADFRYAEPFVDRAGFHLYSLGEHHVQTLERVEHLAKNGRQIYPELYDLVIHDPVPLYLAALCHDLAKPDEGLDKDHHIKGAAIARSFAQEIGLTEYQIERCAALVHDHMIIANLATSFSSWSDSAWQFNSEQLTRLQEPGYRRELLLLTLADKYASNPLQWTPIKEQWLFSSYLELQHFFDGEKTYAKSVLENIRRHTVGPSDGPLDSKIEAFVSDIDKRILSHFSPTILASQVKILEKARAQYQQGTIPFALELIEVSGVPALYHIVLSCRDQSGLFGRINRALITAGMRLTSAYVHTTKDGFACDYLTAEPKNQTRTFLHEDRERFIKSVRAAALDQSANLSSPVIAHSSKELSFSEARFKNQIEVAIQRENEKDNILLFISGKIKDDLIGRIAPLLEFEKLNIIAAKLRAGNREQRYVLYLDTKEYDCARLSSLEFQVREALGV